MLITVKMFGVPQGVSNATMLLCERARMSSWTFFEALLSRSRETRFYLSNIYQFAAITTSWPISLSTTMSWFLRTRPDEIEATPPDGSSQTFATLAPKELILGGPRFMSNTEFNSTIPSNEITIRHYSVKTIARLNCCLQLLHFSYATISLILRSARWAPFIQPSGIRSFLLWSG